MTLSKILTEERRLKILLLLHKSGGPLNSIILASALTETGVPSDEAETLEAMRWLERNGLVTIGGTVIEVATITRAGVGVATGRRVYVGVALPGC